MDRMVLERKAFNEFFKKWEADDFRGQRLGQAFYSYFSLHTLADQLHLQGVYEQDGDEAIKTIHRCFRLE